MQTKRPRKNPRLFHLLFAYFEERTVMVNAIELVLPEIEAKLAALDLANPVHVELVW